MRRIAPASLVSLVFCGLFFASCGGGSKRVLESISIGPDPAVAKDGTVQLVATGTFSAAPVTVTPLPVDWINSPCDNLCNVDHSNVITPVSVNGNGVAVCPKGFSGSSPVYAYAPQDPKLPPDTQGVPLIQGSGTVVCP